MIYKTSYSSSSEADFLSRLFRLREKLDMNNIFLLPEYDKINCNNSFNADISFFTKNMNIESCKLSNFLYTQESRLLLTSIYEKPNKKINFSAESFRKSKNTIFNKQILENSMESSLDFANASR
jgi:hypothetical protein